MPQIKQFTRQVLPSQLDTTQVSASDLANTSGFDALAQGAGQLSETMREIQLKKDRSAYISRLSEFQMENLQRQQELSQMDFEEDTDLVQTYIGDYEERAAKFKDLVPESMQDQFNQDSARLKLNIAEFGLNDQARRAGVRAKINVENTLTNAKNALALDSSKENFETQQRLLRAQIESMPGTQEDKDLAFEERLDELRATRALTIVNKNPAEFLERARKGEFSNTPDLQRYALIAEREIDRLEKERQNSIKKVQQDIAKSYTFSESSGRPSDPARGALLSLSLEGDADITDPESVTGYDISKIDLIVEKQLEDGIQEGFVSVFSNDRSKHIAGILSGTGSAQEFEQALGQIMQEIPQRYHNTAVRDLMRSDMLSSDLKVFMNTDPVADVQVRNAIFEMRQGEKRNNVLDLADAMMKENGVPSSKIENEITNSMAEFFDIQTQLSGTISGVENIRKPMIDIAKYFYTKTGDTARASDMATSWIKDKYETVSSSKGKFVIPSSLGLNKRQIERKSYRARDFVINKAIDKDQILYPEVWSRDPGTKSLYNDLLENDAIWVNNVNNDGLALSLYGAPVRRKDGSVIEVKFDLLEDFEEQQTKKIISRKYGQ